jgi:transposase IS4 family protein
MVKLADAIDWQSFEDGLRECFCANNGRPSCSVRLMVALHYLKYASGMSDEAVLAEWLENPYRQYFTGGIYFEPEYPMDQSSMSRRRKKLAKSGAEQMQEESLKTGLCEGFIKKTELNRVNVDSTVQLSGYGFTGTKSSYSSDRRERIALARTAGSRSKTGTFPENQTGGGDFPFIRRP